MLIFWVFYQFNLYTYFFYNSVCMSEVDRASLELVLLRDLNEAVNRGEPLENVLKLAADGVCGIFSYEACGVHLLEDDGYLKYVALSINPKILKAVEKLTGLKILGYRIPLGEDCPYNEVLESKTPVVSEDMPRFFAGFTDKLFCLEK